MKCKAPRPMFILLWFGLTLASGTLNAQRPAIDPEGVVNGGKSSAWQYGGRGDLTETAINQKLGLWPGGFF